MPGFVRKHKVGVDIEIMRDADGLVSVSACVRRKGKARKLGRCGFSYDQSNPREAIREALAELSEKVIP